MPPRLLIVALWMSTTLACVNGGSSKELTLDVPAGGTVGAVVTTEATRSSEAFSDSFRMDVVVRPRNYEPDEGGVLIEMAGALTGSESMIFADDESGFFAPIANDILTPCEVGERCTVETPITFTSIEGATAEIAVYGTLTVEDGEVEFHEISIAED